MLKRIIAVFLSLSVVFSLTTSTNSFAAGPLKDKSGSQTMVVNQTNNSLKVADDSSNSQLNSSQLGWNGPLSFGVSRDTLNG